MSVIQIGKGLSVRLFYNFFDCPLRGNCDGQEAREAGLMKHRCSFNPSIYKCKYYPEFNSKKMLQKFIP